MSLMYNVEFKSPLTIEGIAGHLEAVLKLRPDPTHGGRIPMVPLVTLVGDEFELDVLRASTSSREMFRGDLAIDIDSEVNIHPYGNYGGFSTSGLGAQLLTQVVVTLLRFTDGDFVFMLDQEQVLLMRTALGTAISSKSGFWNPNTKAALGGTFSERPLPMI